MRRRPWILPAIVLAQLAGSSVWFAGNAVLADLAQRWGTASPTAGWITGAVQLGFISGTLVVALFALADRFSPRWLFLASTIAAALSTLLTALPGISPSGLLALRFVTGCCLAGIYPVGMRIAAGWYDRDLGNALGLLVGALVLGTAAPHLMKGLLAAFPWQAVIAAASLTCLLGGLLMAAAVPDGPYLATGARFDPRVIVHLFRHPPLRAAALGYFGHMWELYSLWAFLPLILNTYGAKTLNVPLWSFLIIAAGSLGCIVGGRISRRVGSAVVASTQLFVSGMCCLLSPLFLAAPPPLFLALMLIWGTVVVGDSPQFSTIVARSAPRERVGSALTLVNCIGFAITVMSLTLLQWLAGRLPPAVLLMPLAVGPAAGLMGLRGRTRPR